MELNLEIIQGSTFEWLIQINDVNDVPLDMVGYTGGTAGARGMVRRAYSDAAATKSFTINILNKTGVLAAVAAKTLHLTTSQIAALQADTVGSCYLKVRLTSTETAALAKGTYVYDIEIEDTTGFSFKPYSGEITVTAEATK